VSAQEAFTLEALGRPAAEARYDVTADAIRAYAKATDEQDVALRRGELAPPVFAIVPAWSTIAPASRAVASEEARRHVVLYAHDVHLHRPLQPGMALVSRAAPIALLQRPNGTALVIRTETRTADGEPVNEQLVTEFFRGLEAPATVGDPPPGHRLDDPGQAVAAVEQVLAEDQPARYAAASGDDFAIHLDDGFARSVGLPGRIVHGLCALAFAGRAALRAAEGEVDAVRRLAVRFSAPVFPGETLTTTVYRVDGGVGFEALAGDRRVLRDGLLVLG
jgi:acyl dehydratase